MRYFHLRHPRRRGRRRAPARCGREAPASLSGNDHESRGAPLAVAGRRGVARGGFAGKNRESDAHPSSPWRPRRCFNLAPRKILPERRVPPKRDLVACELECYSRAPHRRPSGRVACECGVRIACTYKCKTPFSRERKMVARKRDGASFPHGPRPPPAARQRGHAEGFKREKLGAHGRGGERRGKI